MIGLKPADRRILRRRARETPLMASSAISGAIILCLPAMASEPPRIASLGFEFLNTSPAASTPDELARVHRLGDQLRRGLAEPGRYDVVDTGRLDDPIARQTSFRNCNGCELEMGRTVGAELVAYGWVQKVSNLILNINLVIEDVSTGRQMHADSVDIRSNTDESWQRGLRFLLDERIFRTP